MEELKAKNIIENLESIAAEKGADALTGEIIEECCRTNDADPENFKSFICKRIDIQELKKLSSESLDQVAGGARPVKQGMASFLAATSLLGSAANFTVSAGNDALANAKRDIHTAQLIDPQKSVEQKNRRNKKKQSAWTGWDTLKCMGLGSFATCASAIAYWAYSQKNSKNPQGETSKEGIHSPVERNVERNASNEERYALFSKLLDEFEAADVFVTVMYDHRKAFPNASNLVFNLTDAYSNRQLIVKSVDEIDSYNTDDVIREIGEDNTTKLLKKLKDASTNQHIRAQSSSSSSSKILEESSAASSGDETPKGSSAALETELVNVREAEEERKRQEAERKRKEEEDKKKAEEERLRKEEEVRNEASDIITSAQCLAQPKELSDTEKLINDNIEKIKKLSMHFNQTFHCHFNEEGFDAGTFAKHLLRSDFNQKDINRNIQKPISYYCINNRSEKLYSETNLSTLIDDFIKCMRGSKSDYTITFAKFIVAICVPGITFTISDESGNENVDNKLKAITDILFNKIPPGNTNQELSDKLKEIERYGSELKKEYSDYYRSYRSFLKTYNEAVKRTREVTAYSMGSQAKGALTDDISRPVADAVPLARKCYKTMSKKVEEADTKVQKLLDDCAKLGVDITNTNIFVLSELKELIDKYKKLENNGFFEYIDKALSCFSAFGNPQNLSCYTDPDIE